MHLSVFGSTCCVSEEEPQIPVQNIDVTLKVPRSALLGPKFPARVRAPAEETGGRGSVGSGTVEGTPAEVWEEAVATARGPRSSGRGGARASSICLGPGVCPEFQMSSLTLMCL